MTLSLFIPRVFSNISETRISQIFHKLGYGKVSRVDFIEKVGTTGKYKSAYIHFDYWYDNDSSLRFQEKVADPEREARVVYDDPWFWIVLENKPKMQEIQKIQEAEEDLEDEDLEMEQILDEMDEASALMGEESFDSVSADYVNRLESSRYSAMNEIMKLQRKNDDLRHALDTEIYCISYKENEVLDLQTQLAHFKGLLAQYEPDPRFQNKELVQY